MKHTMRFVLCLAMLFSVGGCSKQFMCNLNGTSCPAGSTPSSGQAAPESSSEEAPAEEAPAEEAPAEEASAPAETAGASCKGVGQEVTNINDCCEGLDTETRGYLHNGGTQYCCERSSCHNTPE